MLDSVLVARDRFLSPSTSIDGTGGGVMAPSQCKMVFSLAETTELWRDRVVFWEDVYGASESSALVDASLWCDSTSLLITIRVGFKMSSMAEEAFGDALIEHLPPESIASNLVVVKVGHASISPPFAQLFLKSLLAYPAIARTFQSSESRRSSSHSRNLLR